MRSTGTLVIVFIVLVVGFAGCAGCGTYNGLVAQEERVEQSWGDVETSYQRRADLIPNLVRTVQGAADFEQETLESVTNARARATSINVSLDDLNDPARVQEYLAAQSALGSSLGRLIAVAESYPQLTATAAFQDLQTQLEGTENRINTARRDYNDAVRQYNTRVRQFPGSIIASITGFERRTPFEAEAGAEAAPTVEFN
ncbi:MAG: LemA family protein [Rhodothermales bacterium]|nr:LemA family protein [Rhodothermales bacterium]MBO6778211.1 LemA family protein [Rhodothermales bacterium]